MSEIQPSPPQPHSAATPQLKERRPNHNRALVDQELYKMFELIALGRTDREMIQELKMKNSTFYWYKRKLYKRYGRIARQKTEDSIFLQQEVLAERLIRTYRNLEIKAREDRNNMTGTDLANLASIQQEIAINILKLETEGLRATNKQINQIVQEKANRYLTSIESVEDEPVPDTTTDVQ
jgi:hypothetical protein